MIQNNTTDTYQLRVSVGSEFLTGAWFVSSEPEFTFRVVEKNHSIIGEYWGGYSRHNELYQQKFDLKGNMIDETLIARNLQS
jgi:vancomycin resistance protein VanW